MQTSIDLAECITITRILPGEFYVTKENERVETVLGSCIFACVRDPIAGVGGMNHLKLPGDKNKKGNSELSDAKRYGNDTREEFV